LLASQSAFGLPADASDLLVSKTPILADFRGLVSI
jgi:hypothetical protein